MPTYLLDTLRRALRGPALWVFLGLGLALTWGGLHLGVLALGAAGARAQGLLTSTAQAAASIATLWFLSRTLGQDEASELAVAADCTQPGRAGRYLGRAAGAWLGGLLVGTATVLPFLPSTPVTASPLSLYLAIIAPALLLAGWGAWLASVGGVALVMPGGLLLWIAGHLPWGTEALLPSGLGRIFRALLPGPLPADALFASLLATLLVTLGLAALVVARTAFALGRRAEGRRSTDTG